MRFSTINKQVVQHFNLTSGDLAIGKPPNELEVAMTIAQAYQNQPANQKDINKAAQMAASSNPPCKSYIKCIGDYVAHFSGGENFQLLKYLDNMGSRLAS